MKLTVLAAALLLFLPMNARANPPQTRLDPAARTRAIDEVLRCVNDYYVSPEVAKKLEAAIRDRARKGEYNTITDGGTLAERLTHDLRAVCNDKHLSVQFSEAVLPPDPGDIVTTTPAQMDEMRRVLAKDNYGMPRVEVLRGNVGYIDCRYLAAPEIAGDTYASALNYVANTDALILDLRQCGGATSEDAVPLLCGYFLERATHLRDVWWRTTGATRQSWSLPYVPGKRYLNKPIYLLTSGSTFSGAEELAYDLQNLKRATLVGETTGGGANPGGTRRAGDHFAVWVPNGLVTSPITKTNWEGVGVRPDVPVLAHRALDTAHLAALKHLSARATEPEWKAALAETTAEVEANQTRWKTVTVTLKGHRNAKAVTVAGSFNNWSPQATALKRVGDGWTATVEMEQGRQTYKFIVDGEWMTDPANPETEKKGQFTNSVLIVR